jgi:hypothetical protein
MNEKIKCHLLYWLVFKDVLNAKYKYQAIPITDRGGLQDCETLRLPQCLDSLQTDAGKILSPTHRPSSTTQKHYFSASGTHFCWRLSKPQGLMRLEGLGKLKNVFTSLGLEPATFRHVDIIQMFPNNEGASIPVYQYQYTRTAMCLATLQCA